MPRILISYRRADSDAIAGRIRDRLAAHFGEASVFMDIDSIPYGIDFRDHVRNAVEKSEIVLAMIGPRWLGSDRSGRPRIWEPADSIRIEIEAALNKGIPVIPILVGGAHMPSSKDLPDTLRDLAFRNAATIDAGRDFHLHVERLIRSIERLIEASPAPSAVPGRSEVTIELPRVREGPLRVPDPALIGGLRKLAGDFFQAAKRKLRDGSHPQLLLASVATLPAPHLRSPPRAEDVIWMSPLADPQPDDLAGLARFVAAGQRGFFVYQGALPLGTLGALDRLRVEGKTIIPINVNAMTAAIADENAAILLADLERGYESNDNLFDTKNALVDERFFFGRSELLQQVGTAFARGEHVLVIGLRKCGKSSFLNILRQHLSSHPVCVVDLERYNRHEEDWPAALFHRMLRSYDVWGTQSFSDWPSAPDDAPRPSTATQLEDMLNLRRSWQRERANSERFILILDEAERVFPAAGEIEEARKYTKATAALRLIGQSGSERFLSIIAADLRPWINRRNVLPDGSTNPFYHFFEEAPLSTLSHLAVGELVRGLGGALGVTHVPASYVDELYSLSGGHPSITRMIAGASYRARLKSHELTVADIRVGLEEMTARDTLGSFFRNNLWALMTLEERNTLRDAAGATMIGKLATGMLKRLGVRKVNPYPEAFATLYDQGILREDGKMTIGAFRQWIRDYQRQEEISQRDRESVPE